MIENTFNGQECHYDIMNMDKAQLQPYIYKFRSVLGDGDCFYRGLIFSLLENIILTNNIMLMKELLILYHEKINVKNKLLKDKEYLYVFYHLNISIVSQILYIFIDLMENNSKLTYKTLLKIFLYCPDFDFSIIYFTRYLIYEYISENENKIYSNDFQVEVGCLLPEEYVKDKGDKNEYFFENYYSMQLMVTKSFAEKIVVYITPFVFDIDMNILLYDFGTNGASSTIQEKHFSCENGNKSPIEINLLFRKAHYDIYYKQKYFEEYASENGEFFNADFFDILYVDCMQTRLKTLWAFEIAFFALISPISTFLNNHQIPNSKIVIAIIMVGIAEFAWVLYLSCISSYQKYVSDLIQARRNQKAAALRKDIKDLKDEDLVWGEYKNDELEIIDNMKKKYCMLMPNPSLPQHAEPPEN